MVVESLASANDRVRSLPIRERERIGWNLLWDNEVSLTIASSYPR